jgi:hypothetical protein
VCSVIIALGSSFPEQILLWLYGAEYAQNAFLVHWWGAIYLFTDRQFSLTSDLTAVEYTRPLFISIIGEAAFGIRHADGLCLADLVRHRRGDVRPSGDERSAGARPRLVRFLLVAQGSVLQEGVGPKSLCCMIPPSV